VAAAVNSPNYDHLEKIRDDIRDEIKRRIDQRDKYSIQLTVVLSAIVGVSFSKPGFEKILLRPHRGRSGGWLHHRPGADGKRREGRRRGHRRRSRLASVRPL
jgi:hypothetical protein